MAGYTQGVEEQPRIEEDKEEGGEAKVEDVPLASLSEVYSFGEGKFWYVCGGMFASAVTGCVFPTMAYIFADSFEQLGATTNNDEFLANIRGIAYSLMVLGVVAFTFMTLQSALLETAAGIMTRDMKDKWFQALLRQDMAFFDIKDVSGTSTIITSNGAKFKKGTGRKMGEMIQFTFTFLGGMGYAFWSSWQASLITLAVVPFMSASALILVRLNTTQTARANETYAEAGSIVYSTVSSIRTILSLNAIPIIIEKFKDATQKAFEGAAGLAYLLGLANGGLMGSFLLAYVGITLYGSFLLYDSVRDTGCDPSGTVAGVESCSPRGVEIFGALMGITFAAAVLPQVSVSLEALTGARAACYPALVTMRRKVDDDDADTDESKSDPQRRGSTLPLPKYVIDSSSDQGAKPESVEGEIVFNNCNFSYPTRPETSIFDGFSLKIEAGKTVALVGASGSGKSTCVQLIERFYDPTGGSITLDGVDLKTLNVNWLRSQIGLVGQEPALFACSIRDNILYGKPDATQEEIEQAARNANCHDFITAFTDGYDTQVGDKGAQLSGGQKQRIAIARILITQPKVLLLDESTSALDSESEVVVQEALDALLQKGGRTTIMIAHRLSTVRNADMIAVVSEGHVVETGTHDELLDKQGHYHALVEAQKAKKKDDGTDADSTPSSRSGSMHVSEDSGAVGNDGTPGLLMLFKDVHFRYPSRPENKILRGLNLTVYEGETLALVGPSGHGKSTIMQLIERFYDPDRGTVEMHGVDLKDINVTHLRNKVGLVSQEPTLFDTSIAENIRYGKPDATQEETEKAAKRANIHDTIMEFPEMYETSVGAGGTQVSGGQKQRIAIARALVKRPNIMLLDEATSALDTASEKIVQAALDEVMSSKTQTTVVIAHRLSTIRNADRIAVIADGKVREIGTHDELMAKEQGHYRRLQMYQDLDTNQEMKDQLKANARLAHTDATKNIKNSGEDTIQAEKSLEEIDKEATKKNAKRAWVMGSQDRGYFIIGGIGACLAGLVFPGWGFVFAYMIELLYTPIYPCQDDIILPPIDSSFQTCQEYWDSEADSMREQSFLITYGLLGIIAATMFGNMLLFYGFNIASERMNKRVRDGAFQSLVRQEVGYFDVHPVAVLTSRMSDDAALLQSFSGEPIRTLIMNTASVAVGLIVSFVFMWPFALITLAILPFMAFGAEMEMRMYMGEDEGEEDEDPEHSPGAIIVETLLNIRTVASLNIEPARVKEFDDALAAEDPTPLRTNSVKGCAAGLGQFVQMWGIALMFWWGGWLLLNYPNSFTFRDFLISMFSLLFSLSGMAIAAQGATDRDKAKLAADRIFELTDRESAIDPLSEEGKKDV